LENPITIARHAYGDIYGAAEYRVGSQGKAELLKPMRMGAQKAYPSMSSSGRAFWHGVYNNDASIRSFARSCFTYALSYKQDLCSPQGYHLQNIRPHIQGHFPGIMTRVQTDFEHLALIYLHSD
jgi:isocitrate dehydrogenase